MGNLSKRNWQGSKVCCFCDHEETIQHLFFECPLAKVVWCIVHMTFGISPPKNTRNLFGNWLNGVDKRVKGHIRVGICALLWAMWHVRNDLTFNKSKQPFFCRSFPLLLTGPVRGYVSSRRGSARTWIFGATVWRRLHMIYSAGAASSLIAGSPHAYPLADILFISF